MTEEEIAEEYLDKKYLKDMGVRNPCKQAYLAGLKAGKPKWHKVADGDLPKENEYIMIYSKLADNIAVGKRRCAGKLRKRPVYEWYFATYEGTYCLRDKDIIAWKEIVLPKELENDQKD